MKLFIAALAASIAFPAAASAETWWLVISGKGTYGREGIALVLEKVAMESEEQCETAGQKIFNSKDLEAPKNIHSSDMIWNIRYICLVGK